MEKLPDNIMEMLNELKGGFNRLIDLTFVKAAPDEYVAEIKIDERHHQPYGIVHGGVYASMIETLCSVGAALSVYDEGKSAVGLENSTSFIRAVRSGTLRCAVSPVLKGKRSHVWEARITDDRKKLVATGRVRLMILEPGSAADGETVAMNLG